MAKSAENTAKIQRKYSGESRSSLASQAIQQASQRAPATKLRWLLKRYWMVKVRP